MVSASLILCLEELKNRVGYENSSYEFKIVFHSHVFHASFARHEWLHDLFEEDSFGVPYLYFILRTWHVKHNYVYKFICLTFTSKIMNIVLLE